MIEDTIAFLADAAYTESKVLEISGLPELAYSEFPL